MHKLTAISYLLAFIAINFSIPTFTITGGLIDMGYGSRGESMLGGSTSVRSEEPIQPIPISFDYDRA